MSEIITYGYGDILDFGNTAANASAMLSQCYADLNNLRATLAEGHFGRHSDAWQAQMTQVNQALDHFSEVVMHFGVTHGTVVDHAQTVDGGLAQTI